MAAPAFDPNGAGPIIPRSLLARTDISATDKLVLAFIIDKQRFFMAHGGDLHMGIRTIAKHVGLDEKTVRQCLARLSEREMLFIQERPGRTSVLCVPGLHPGRNARRAPVKSPGLRGRSTRGTPGEMPDEWNSRSDLEKGEMSGVEPSSAVSKGGTADVPTIHVRYRAGWASFVQDQVQRGLQVPNPNPNDRQISVAIEEHRLNPAWSEERIRAEIERTADGLRSKDCKASFKAIIEHLGEDWGYGG